MQLFIMCGQGLEPILSLELNELGLHQISPGYCGVYVENASMNDVYTINYCSRIASRVLVPLAQFHCPDRHTLYEQSLKIDWSRFFTEDKSFAIDANVHHDELRNSLFAAQVVKDALCDRLKEEAGFRPSVDIQSPDIQINLFIYDNKAVISLDTSGQPLHKRGYRKETGSAPLQETLAAALLRIANYDGTSIVLDPCAGSGTLLIEAALMASKTPPGFFRKSWGFEHHPDFNQHAWDSFKKSVDTKRQKLAQGMFWAIEREPEIADFCRINCENAGFKNSIHIICGDFTTHQPEADYNFLITNPPHGKRLASEEALVPLYRALGDFMKKKMLKPARGFIFTSSMMLAKQVGLHAKRRHVIKSSGMDARLLEFDLY